MNMRFFVACLSLAALTMGVVTSPEQYLRRSAILDKDGRFYVEWGTGDNDDIVIRVTVWTLGYVALGFSRDGSMVDSDIVIGWVSDGKVFLQDRYAEGYQMPELDYKQDWELISGDENATHTVLFFRRKLVTCDPQDFALEYDNTIRLMHAYSFEDPLNEFTIHYHGPKMRGFRSFMLLQPKIPRETDVEYWDVLTSKFSLSPDWETMYWCKLFKSPKLSQKHHITMVEGLLLDGYTTENVHHVILFECAGADSRDLEQYVGADGYDCHDPDSPDFVRQCDGYFTIWGKGNEGKVYPPHIGLSLDPSSTKYYMLQVHFDNFKRVSGEPRRAGLRLHHTPNLRQYDAASVTVGKQQGPNLAIPPGLKNFCAVGHGNPDCTDIGMPSEGVRVTNMLLHTHQLGSRIKLRQFRNKNELPPLVDNKHYDPNYQEYHTLSKERILLPGDQLTLECTYDSRNRTVTSFGGFSTREEMCLAFLIYYPRFGGVYGCKTLVPKKKVAQFIGAPELIRITSTQEDSNEAFVQFLSTYDWNRTAIRRYERNMLFSKQETFCVLGNGDTSSVRSTVSYPEELVEYVESPVCVGGGDENASIK